MIGSQDDDYKILLVKRFILPFENGICVIKHWRMHNLIRQDRYKETSYLEQKSTLRIKENGSYTEKLGNVIQNGNQLAPQVRLGKVSKDTDLSEQIDTSMKNYLESDLPEEVIDQDGNSLNEKPEDQNVQWREFLKYWNGRVKELYGAEYNIVGGDKKSFHKVFNQIKRDKKIMTHITEFYLTGHKGETSEVQTIRAALSNHSLMLFEKNRYKL